MNRKLLGIIAGISLIGLTGCTQTDIVAKYGISSFASLTEVVNPTVDAEWSSWVIEAPDGSAKFLLSQDFKTTAPHDVMLMVDIQPFLDAGLDVSRLPQGMVVENWLMLGQSLGDQAFSESAKSSAEASLKELVRLSRDTLGYHEVLDHYGIALGEGNVFEWAKDRSTNDKDLVFVLNPDVFREAGVDVSNVAGWIFAEVEVMDESGKPIMVEKLLKPFNLD
jgi:hypothetical protein